MITIREEEVLKLNTDLQTNLSEINKLKNTVLDREKIINDTERKYNLEEDKLRAQVTNNLALTETNEALKTALGEKSVEARGMQVSINQLCSDKEVLAQGLTEKIKEVGIMGQELRATQGLQFGL